MPRAHFLDPLLAAPAEAAATLAVLDRGPIAARIHGAFDSASRRRGLLGRTGLAEGEALVIAPSNAVHTFGMRFPIDVIYARRDGRVAKVRERLRPNRVSAAWRAFAVIELPAGTIGRTGVSVGDRLVVSVERGCEL